MPCGSVFLIFLFVNQIFFYPFLPLWQVFFLKFCFVSNILLPCTKRERTRFAGYHRPIGLRRTPCRSKNRSTNENPSRKNKQNASCPRTNRNVRERPLPQSEVLVRRHVRQLRRVHARHRLQDELRDAYREGEMWGGRGATDNSKSGRAREGGREGMRCWPCIGALSVAASFNSLFFFFVKSNYKNSRVASNLVGTGSREHMMRSRALVVGLLFCNYISQRLLNNEAAGCAPTADVPCTRCCRCERDLLE